METIPALSSSRSALRTVFLQHPQQRAMEAMDGYYESEDCGDVLHAQKPTGSRGWDCGHSRSLLLMGFPHLYYPSDPKLVERFLRACAKEV